MRYFAALLITLLTALIVYAESTVVIMRHPAVAPSGQAFSDDFNRSDSTDLGANWTEEISNFSIVSNELRVADGGIRWNTATDDVDQYCSVEYRAFSNDGWFGCAFRFNATGDFYAVWGMNEGGTGHAFLQWSRVEDTGAPAQTNIQNCELTTGGAFSAGNVFGAEIEGTGTDTVVRVWKNPGARPWGAATCTFTNNPTSTVDTSKGVGIFTRYVGADELDNWTGGDL